jgi:hypothetical protein
MGSADRGGARHRQGREPHVPSMRRRNLWWMGNRRKNIHEGKLAAVALLLLASLAPREAHLVTRPTVSFEGAVCMASYILLVEPIQDQKLEPTAPGSPMTVEVAIRKVIFVRQDWTDTQIKLFDVTMKVDASGKHVIADPAIQANEKIKIRIEPSACKIDLQQNTSWIALVDRVHPEQGIFFCNLDWAVVPPTREAEILRVLGKGRSGQTP